MRAHPAGRDAVRLGTDLVNVLFTAVDRNNRVIGDIRQEEISVLEDGRPQQIFTFKRETTLPINIAILMDLTNHPANINHIKNPQREKLLNPTMAQGTTSSGVGSDLVYRDPWGTPYIISMDLNYDDKCRDAFYKWDAVSAVGLNGLVNPAGANSYEYVGGVMVWSFGPDKTASKNATANTIPNKDNVLTWKQ